MPITAEIEAFASTLPLDTNATMRCPSCEQPKMSVIRFIDSIAFHCWRASCGYSGRRQIGGAGLVSNAAGHLIAGTNVNPYMGRSRALTEAEGTALQNKFGIPGMLIQSNILRDPDTGRYLLVVANRYNTRLGYVSRRPWGLSSQAGLKSMNFVDDASEPFMAWYGGIGYASTCYLVEDQMSALKVHVATGKRAVALLGTDLNSEKHAILRGANEELVLMLDRDATSKAFNLAAKWHTKVICCHVDPKDMPMDELKRI